MQKIISHIKENPDIKNLGIALMFASGLSVGELVSLKYSDFSGNTISIHRTETRYKNSEGHYEYAVKESPKTKAGKRTVVIPDEYGKDCTIYAINLKFQRNLPIKSERPMALSFWTATWTANSYKNKWGIQILPARNNITTITGRTLNKKRES